jgi:outer membrane protein assembly factor BamE (lipoprotein component of BamABCDE complex)
MRVLFIAAIVTGCSMFYKSDKFDRDVWLSHNDMTDTSSPRAKMTKDLLQNHLKEGMTRDSILAMLGKPYFDGLRTGCKKELNFFTHFRSDLILWA